MTVVQALPRRGDVFFDVRDDGRVLRVGWHPEQGVVVLSTWRHGSCISSCHLARSAVPGLISELVEGLAVPATDETWTDPIYVDFAGRRQPTRLPIRFAELLRKWRPRR